MDATRNLDGKTTFYRLKDVLLHGKESIRSSCSMKHRLLLFLLCLLALSTTGCQRKAYRTGTGQSLSASFDTVMLIGSTPVKNQGNSELCWAYAMLATMESEHIAKGDSVNLSVTYLTRMLLQDKATEYYLSSGRKSISLRGVASMLLHYIYKYGIVPYDSYESPTNVNYRVLCKKVEQVCRKAIARQGGLRKMHEAVDAVLDTELGYLPGKTVHLLGAEYTPVEFAHSVCYPQEYLSFTSFTHHPFGNEVVLEVPDNSLQDRFLNVPLDVMMNRIVCAVKGGHPVCWEGDISEQEFRNTTDGFVDLPSSAVPVTQSSRQEAFERLQTTDDHAMTFTGMGWKKGRLYFICRNSWGNSWGRHGFVFLSEDYVRLKTVAVVMSKDAL